MRFRILLVIMIAVLALAACQSGAQTEATPRTIEVSQDVSEVQTETDTEEVAVLALPEVDPLAVSGDIVTAGSSTVFPLSERMAERFQDEGYSGNITIDSIAVFISVHITCKECSSSHCVIL